MAKLNEHYLKLQAGYLFPEIGRRVRRFQESHPDAHLIRLGIGDVTLPLPHVVGEAIRRATHEMENAATFRGYGPEQGYAFLREAISRTTYGDREVQVDPDEIFISDGSKCDSGNFQEIFSTQATIAVTDPVYPVYVDSQVMAGRTGPMQPSGRYERLIYLPGTADNGFHPSYPERPVDLVYLCSPNNPTGCVLSREQLGGWVEWARQNKAILLFDAAYEAYIQDARLPRSIFEIPGAREVAVEFRSFSKDAGFTGVRCAYTVVPGELMAAGPDGKPFSVRDLWQRRHTTKFNGVAYPIQRGAEAALTPAGQAAVRERVTYYLANAACIRKNLIQIGFSVFGGENAPYLWFRVPGGLSSWEFFDDLLNRCQVVGTPGAGFGPSGEGYFRLSAFGAREHVATAMQRIREVYG